MVAILHAGVNMQACQLFDKQMDDIAVKMVILGFLNTVGDQTFKQGRAPPAGSYCHRRGHPPG